MRVRGVFRVGKGFLYQKTGYKWAGVDHRSHELLRYDPIRTSTGRKKTLTVNSNMIDGQWTPLTEFMPKFMPCGVHRSKYPLLAAEFEWRHNNQASDLYDNSLRSWRIMHSESF